MTDVAEVVVADHKATLVQVREHAEAIRVAARSLGLDAPQVRQDGTVVVRSTEPGYGPSNKLSSVLSELVGAYVHVITDDVPGAASAVEL